MKHRMTEGFASGLGEGIANRSAKIGVIGLGYAGLPLALEFANAGFAVTGVDIDHDRCALLSQGKSYIDDVEDSAISPLVLAGNLRAVTSLCSAGDLDVVIVCVPTPLNKTREPDLSHVLAAVTSAKRIFGRGCSWFSSRLRIRVPPKMWLSHSLSVRI